MQGEGGGFDFSRAFYLSVHTLDNDSGFQYAKMRVSREILDSWLAKRLAFQGHKFDDSDITLTDEDPSERNDKSSMSLFEKE